MAPKENPFKRKEEERSELKDLGAAAGVAIGQFLESGVLFAKGVADSEDVYLIRQRVGARIHRVADSLHALAQAIED